MLKHLRAKTSMLLSLIVVFLFSMTGTVFGKAATSQTGYNYVALGDSLAAGQPPNGEQMDIYEGYGYTDYIYKYLQSEDAAGSFDNLGVSGTKSTELLGYLTYNSPTYDSDMVDSIKNDDNPVIVTLDIGADDILPLFEWAISYPTDPTDPIAFALWFGNYPGSMTPSQLAALWYGPGTESQKIQAIIQAEVPGVLSNITQIIIAIHTINGNAKIYLMGYYDAFVNYQEAKDNPFLYDAFKTNLLPGFNGSLSGIADGANALSIASGGAAYVSFIPTINAVDSKELPGDIHPNLKGYKDIAKGFWKEIQSDLLK